ncbi:hypothetical protein PCL_12108 [Purpureocillium lilacinum]|uniref:Uncharacterized protein n=1 Tax=Purpureocillium lilacinum TaxID=33203 RepID=A0A2U3DPF9_PURLI|nr:hypothetical protein PCL_12108 [Purpureocillium lilacinum]
MFHGSVAEMGAEMLRALQLSGEVSHLPDLDVGLDDLPPNRCRERTQPQATAGLDNREYWAVYERALRTSALRFPNIHHITGMSRRQRRVVFQAMDHVLALHYFNPTRLQEAKTRVRVFFQPAGPPRSTRESASLLLQQEVLELVLEHLADFKAQTVKAYLGSAAGGINGKDDRPPESEPSTQAAGLTDAFCNYAARLPMVCEDKNSAPPEAAIVGVPHQSGYVVVETMRRRRAGRPVDTIGRRPRGAAEALTLREMTCRAIKASVPRTMSRQLWWRLHLGRQDLEKTLRFPRKASREHDLTRWPRSIKLGIRLNGNRRRKRLTDDAQQGDRMNAPARNADGQDRNATAPSQPGKESWLDRTFTGAGKPVEPKNPLPGLSGSVNPPVVWGEVEVPTSSSETRGFAMPTAAGPETSEPMVRLGG